MSNAEPATSSTDEAPKTYEWRLVSEHQGEDNETTSIRCELKREGEDFEPFKLDELNSPFLNFLQCALSCQLAYLRMNSAERGLRLSRVEGQMKVIAQAFVLQELKASFTMHLREGSPSEEDLAYIRERCMACPVSRNLQAVPLKDTAVKFSK